MYISMCVHEMWQCIWQCILIQQLVSIMSNLLKIILGCFTGVHVDDYQSFIIMSATDQINVNTIMFYNGKIVWSGELKMGRSTVESMIQ